MTEDLVLVRKYGGESVDITAGAFAMHECDAQLTRLAVVSAFSGVTDQLFSLVRKGESQGLALTDFDAIVDRSCALLDVASRTTADCVRDQISAKLKHVLDTHRLETNPLIREDIVIGLGERISASVVAGHWNHLAAQERFVAVDLGELVSPLFLSGNKQDYLFTSLEGALQRWLQPVLAAGKTPVITGYMGVLPGGIMAHMDRGYSDSTAILVARALLGLGSAERRVRVEICKTVAGIFSADPNLFKFDKNPLLPEEDPDMPSAVLRPEITKSLAARGASSGVKALNARAAAQLEQYPRITARVRHTAHPDAPYTEIVDELSSAETPGIRVVTGKLQRRITLRNTSALDSKNWLANIFSVTDKAGVSVNVVESPDNTCSIWVDEDTRKVALVTGGLKEYGDIVNSNVVGLITCLEDGIRSVAESNRDVVKVLTILMDAKINVIDSSASSNGTITLTVDKQDLVRAIRAVHSKAVALK